MTLADHISERAEYNEEDAKAYVALGRRI